MRVLYVHTQCSTTGYWMTQACATLAKKRCTRPPSSTMPGSSSSSAMCCCGCSRWDPGLSGIGAARGPSQGSCNCHLGGGTGRGRLSRTFSISPITVDVSLGTTCNAPRWSYNWSTEEAPTRTVCTCSLFKHHAIVS